MYGSDKSKAAAKQRVLDPFAGRGSTGIAAMGLRGLYTLIEIDEDQHKIAKANLLEAIKPSSPKSK
jgi:16S rRNA G966 N2-methylase RsmD